MKLPEMLSQKALRLLLIAVLIMHLADYLIIPILPVILNVDEDLSPKDIGFILACGAIAFQFGSIAGGLSSDRIGRKITLAAGAALEALALFGFGLSRTYGLFILFEAVNYFGGGLYIPPIKAAIAETAKDDGNRTSAFSLRGVAANLGVVMAGLVSLSFLKTSPRIAFFSAASVYVLLFMFSLFFIPEKKPELHTQRKVKYREIFKNKAFIIFCMITLLVWAVYSELSLVLPLRAASVLNNGIVVGSIWTVTSLVVVFFQNPVARLFLNKWHHYRAMTAGVAIMGVALFTIGFAENYILLLISGVIFVFGEMFTTPTIDAITGRFADKAITGTYFSITNILYGLGVALGSFLGGEIIGRFGVDNIFSYTLFLIFSAFIVLFVLIIRKIPGFK